MKDASDSELSDLEDEQTAAPKPEPVDDIGDIEPEYYSDGGVPVFVPTMKQFEDFTLFMKKINKYGMLSGIVKVIPPEEWKAAQPRLDEQVKTIRVKEPIKQDIMGTSGTYRQANMVHQRSYNLPQWRQLCDQSEHQPPARRGERRANQDKPSRASARPKAVASIETPTSSASKRRRGRPFKAAAKGKRGVTVDTEDGGQSTPDRLPTPVSPSMQQDEGSVKGEDVDDDDDTPIKGRMGSRQAKAVSVSSRRKNNRREREGKVDEAAFKDFNYELEGDEYTPERCEELERAYWKTLTYAPPLYGADMPGTLFDERTKAWNLGKLDNILDVLGSNIPGVNSAYLYLGMWKATFAWHLEDVDLYSINYLHFGAPKQWYSIAQPDARRFEAAMKTIWPTDAKACDQFLRHKTFLISPSHLLSNYNIKVNKIVHKPGEFVITFPYGYHSGYNLGYNCAEAVNFGLEEWLQYGRVAKKCDCDQAQDSVWINVHDLERKMRGEETEFEESDEEEEEDEDDEDETNTSNLATIPEHGSLKTKVPKQKRKRPIDDKGGNASNKRTRFRIKVPAKEPCILCPNDIPSEPLLPTGNNGEKVHRICAQYIPETSIEEGKVIDVEHIHKDRMALKCNYCRSKKGACFQCSRKKCTRAYHATCAAAAGVFVEQGETAVFGEDQKEYKDWGIEFGCRFHRVKRDKKHDYEFLSQSERIRKAGAAFQVGDVCQVQYHKGDIWAGSVVENCKDEEMLLLDVLPRGDRVEVSYTWLLLPDPADYHLTKPSANAIPMPKSRKDKELLNTSKRQADDNPRKDDPFVEGHTWAEFACPGVAINPHQVKVDMSKEYQTISFQTRQALRIQASK
ncbi:putative DNA damage-responsive transcriptional repressor RPH1 [Glarea lozoyensis 74030]|uniref:[histone H3]-trimethyl-L-lysine(9) demethylase n=1 Tax=Glarea lozoyensis (strain ATCC 74030 / MF5533) TaxID=1104152 RepID=H0EPR2_GLAL7|nr:putative DNA damage-responsive transcriptional repressor RPH1 [Glarea lozoyensis 74030]